MRLLPLLFLFVFSVYGQNQKQPNIILMIGDGMGLTQISSGMYANKNATALEGFEFVGLSKTHAIDQLVTDSAASGTAMATGYKTYNKVLGIDSQDQPQKSILEHCEALGYTTALIATSSIVHATPASFYAKVPLRNQYQDIALQLSEHDVDLFIGGGKKHFVSREDKRNLISEMNEYEFVSSIREFEKSTADKIGYFTYNDQPPPLKEGRSPDLESLVDISLQKLSQKEAPFFMMIEGSQIDWGSHDNNLEYMLSEFEEFDRTIQKVLDFANKQGNTLVIVTADHETGGLNLSGGIISRGIVKGIYSTKGHSATMVPVFSFGPKASLFKGIYENTAIFDKMKQALTP